jgi:hypothetical protein
VTRSAVPQQEQARRYVTQAVLEVTLIRQVEDGADHQQTADAAAADLANGTPEGWTEGARRVKSVRVLPE